MASNRRTRGLALSAPAAALVLAVHPVTSTAAEAPLSHTRPAWPSDHPALCSSRRPLCVHAPDAGLASELAPTLEDLEQVAFTASTVLNWPPPLTDRSLGGSPAFDVYLAPQRPEVIVTPDPPTDTGFVEQTSAFALLQPSLPAGCYRSFVLAQAYARAGIYALDAAANDVLATASAAYVASVVAPCLVAFGDAIDDFQLRPDRALSHGTADSRGAMLLPWYLQETRGKMGTLDLVHALWVLAQEPPSKKAETAANEPDFLDATSSLVSSGSVHDVIVDFAVARAFTGSRDDGLHFPTSRVLDALGAIRFEWSVPYSSLPRRLAPAYPVEPTGSSYLWLDLEGVSMDAPLTVRARWESPDVFRFAFVLVDERGVAVARHDPVSPERGTELQWHLDRFGEAAGMIVVATNLGATYSDIAFDPDVVPYTSRSYTVELFAQ